MKSRHFPIQAIVLSLAWQDQLKLLEPLLLEQSQLKTHRPSGGPEVVIETVQVTTSDLRLDLS